MVRLWERISIVFVVVMSLFCTLVAVFSLLFLWKLVTEINCALICPPTPTERLKEMLGAAYNARYMSIDKPADLFAFTPEFTDFKRNFTSESDYKKVLAPKDDAGNSLQTTIDKESQDFHVPPTYRRLLRDDDRFKELIKRVYAGKRNARSVDGRLPWHCAQRVEWLDLGQDHFPRYVRSVKCTAERCFYGHYQCKAKAFTVKVLRRIADKCLEMTPELREKFNYADGAGFDEPTFFEPWVFEEIAVNFCCDCVV